MIPDLRTTGLPRLVVTSHPNHELAILGALLRLRPAMLFLTDGGAPARIAETRRALDRHGLLEQAQFLAIPEPTMYRALVEGEHDLLAELTLEVRERIARSGARQVWCESVELYNPLHDLTLPLVAAAIGALPAVEILEFPLIAEVSEDDVYRVQRLADPLRPDVVELDLSRQELATKLEARGHDYPSLVEQLGETLLELDERHLGVEIFARVRRDGAGRAELPAPGAGHALRYERRGEALKRRGEVERVITYRDHFVPAVDAIYAAAGGASAVSAHYRRLAAVGDSDGRHREAAEAKNATHADRGPA